MGVSPKTILNVLGERIPVIAGFTASCAGVYVNIHSHCERDPNSLLFWDAGTLTDAVACVRAGQDPYVVLGFDRLQRPFNYPPIWLQIKHLGVTPYWATGIGAFLFERLRQPVWHAVNVRHRKAIMAGSR